MIRLPHKTLLCLAGLLLLACGNSSINDRDDSARDTTNNNPVVGSDTLPSLAQVVYSPDSFLLDSFLVLIDSFFTAYAGQEITLEYHVDSLIMRDTSDHSRRYVYMPVKNSIARWLYIDGGEGTSTMQLEVVECCYPDSLSAEKGWMEFKRLSAADFRVDGDEDDQFPCLSYGTDYAFRTGNSLFVICTYCNWDYDKHLIMASLLKRTIVKCNPLDEIKCRCGDIKPRKN